ncbi:transposable element Tcb1 transposase [Trichonephila clavipes]|nr:transposable element Tcb1 transposase [Trichonephila clavipes]
MWAAEWNEAVLTDESRICLQHHDGRIRVWSHLEERMLKSCVINHLTGPEPRIMSQLLDDLTEEERQSVIDNTFENSDRMRSSYFLCFSG